jgi:hypothetical protein
MSNVPASPKRSRHIKFTPTELRTIAFISTLVLAGFAIALRIKDPVVWTFLATALSLAFGRSTN